MQYSEIQLAFIGAGPHATDSLYPCIPHIPGAIIGAVYSRSPERAKQTARRFGIKSWFTSIDRLLEATSTDGAVIVGPPQLHATAAQACLRKGIPVFIEKPPAIDSRTVKELIETADSNKTFGMVGFNKRFGTAYRIAQEICRRSEFGEVTFLDMKFSNGPWPPFWDIREREKSFLIGQAIHMFDLSRVFGGEVKTVFAQLQQRIVDKFAYAVQFGFVNGALATFNMTCNESWSKFHELISVTGEGNYFTIENGLQLKYFPEKDWIELPETELYNLYQGWEVSAPMTRMSNYSPTHLGYLGELKAFVNAVRSGKTPSPDLADGYAAMKLCDAVLQSAQTGQPIDLVSGPVE
jgi:myo-inositol 2-dehydrogenase / D-chiro-inositol 1-dehydrogenase